MKVSRGLLVAGLDKPAKKIEQGETATARQGDGVRHNNLTRWLDKGRHRTAKGATTCCLGGVVVGCQEDRHGRGSRDDKDEARPGSRPREGSAAPSAQAAACRESSNQLACRGCRAWWLEIGWLGHVGGQDNKEQFRWTEVAGEDLAVSGFDRGFPLLSLSLSGFVLCSKL